MKTLNFFLITFLFSASSFATPNFEQWIKDQEKISIKRMMLNISPSGTKAGTVVASPSKDDPNYYFHWVRDASLVMSSVIGIAQKAPLREQQKYLQTINDFILISQHQQSTADLGEPRFQVDGSVDTIPWSRPQFDGPALRALTLIRFLRAFPETKLKKETEKVIRTDLEFVSKVWSLPCYDIWEELQGRHFYTQSLQYAALKAAANFLKEESYLVTAKLMETTLNSYWLTKKSYIGASFDLQQSPNSVYKISNLDTAVILAILHAGPEFGFYWVTDEKVIQTAEALEKLFKEIYPLGSPAIGRFGDDVYFGGNPWYMTTAAFAEFYYERAYRAETSADKKFLTLKGDSFLKTIRRYRGSQGELSEQFDRLAGVPVSARDLTWSYASFLSAIQARAKLRN